MMERNTKLSVIRIVCALILIAAVVISVSSIFRFSYDSFADSEKYAVGNAEITEKITNLDIDWTSGTVNVAYHNDDTIVLNETSKTEIRKDRQMCWLVDGDTLHIRYMKPGFHLSNILQIFGNSDKALTITLPESLNLKEAKIAATSADLDIPSLKAETLALSVTSGDIRACADARHISAEMTSGDVDLTSENKAEEISVSTTSGDISIKAGDADTLHAKTTSGTITAETGSLKDISAATTSGNIFLKTKAFDSIDIHATSGDVRAELPEKPGFTASIHTTSGDINHELPLTLENGSYISGDGSGKVNIDTTSGDVVIAGSD